MNQKLLLLPLLISILLPVQAQRIHAYATAGTITSQIEGDELKGFNHWGFAGGVGAIADLDNHDTWSLAIETAYSCRGIYNHKYSPSNYYNIDL
ncbi:MAG: hypothetical protein J5641_01475, partial [Bacteroidales bacterium]|nr:hypothetical protein [Bacteroidales bacterium]